MNLVREPSEQKVDFLGNLIEPHENHVLGIEYGKF